MINARLLFALCLVATGCDAQTPNASAKATISTLNPANVSLVARDGVRIFGTFYESRGRARAIILQFHQAGSNKAEYKTIAPKLAEAGFAVLAIDQRSGGRNFGANNETVDLLGQSRDYLAAKPDLEAAIAWASAKKLPIIIWGSSYSAALVYLVASEKPDKVVAALAFSGGNYLGGDRVTAAARTIAIPVFATSAKSEVAKMRPILDNARSTNKVFFVPMGPSAHGSSALIAEKNPGGTEEIWAAVFAFLNSIEKG